MYTKLADYLTGLLTFLPTLAACYFARLRGDLYYVFLEKGRHGRVPMDAQDPNALWKYSDDLRSIVEDLVKEAPTR